MVKKAQLKFILCCSLILFVLVSCFFGFSCFTLKTGTEREVFNQLTEIKTSVENNFTPSFSHEYFVADIYNYESEESFTVTIKLTQGFEQENIENLTKQALSKSYPLGSFNTVYYHIVYSTENNGVPKLIIGADAKYILANYNDAVIDLLIVSIIIWVVLVILFWLFSFWVFKPIHETLFKQRQFISDVSHEIKTPVTIISANTDVLKNGGGEEYLDNIKEQSERIGILVNDLLTLSNIEENVTELKRESFSVSKAVLKTALPFDAVAFEKGKFLTFNVEENLSAMGVKEDFIKICGILLDNAVKYATPQTEITIGLRREGKHLYFTVFNRGCEVQEADKENIFERFFRADSSRSRETGGSGLGLSIAKSLATRNHWKISAKLKYGESTLMEVIL